MPELPEVETTLQSIKPYVLKHKITQVILRHKGLRWPFPEQLPAILTGQTIDKITRRGKYLLLGTKKGTLIIHLGMSGSLRITHADVPAAKHDHFQMDFNDGTCLRMRDPRRFGAVLWTDAPAEEHVLLNTLGPEPLGEHFTGEYMAQKAKNKKTAIKTFLMNSKIVVGVGNIYANEALYDANIHPLKPAGKLTLKEYRALVAASKKVLQAAIKKGGTTLRDFVHGKEEKGYFSLRLKVYGRRGKPCLRCRQKLKEIRIAQRTTVFCSHCQKK